MWISHALLSQYWSGSCKIRLYSYIVRRGYSISSHLSLVPCFLPFLHRLWTSFPFSNLSWIGWVPLLCLTLDGHQFSAKPLYCTYFPTMSYSCRDRRSAKKSQLWFWDGNSSQYSALAKFWVFSILNHKSYCQVFVTSPVSVGNLGYICWYLKTRSVFDIE